MITLKEVEMRLGTITKKMLKEMENLHGDMAYVIIYSDGSGYINNGKGYRAFDFDFIEELMEYLTNENPSMRIVTEERPSKSSSDWIAFVEGHREMWEVGATEAEAVEKLLVTRNPEYASDFVIVNNYIFVRKRVP